MYSKNRVGPITDPCRTPDVTGQGFEEAHWSATIWVLSLRKAVVQLVICSQILMEIIFASSLACDTLSNALLKSNKHASTSFPLYSSLEISATSSTSCVSQLSFALKPCCFG